MKREKKDLIVLVTDCFIFSGKVTLNSKAFIKHLTKVPHLPRVPATCRHSQPQPQPQPYPQNSTFASAFPQLMYLMYVIYRYLYSIELPYFADNLRYL